MLPGIRLDAAVDDQQISLYATPHALIACHATTDSASVSIYAESDGTPLPVNRKLQPYLGAVNSTRGWIAGTIGGEMDQGDVVLPSSQGRAGRVRRRGVPVRVAGRGGPDRQRANGRRRLGAGSRRPLEPAGTAHAVPARPGSASPASRAMTTSCGPWRAAS